MSYTHHVGADFAASELARMLAVNPSLCYVTATVPPAISCSATYEPSSSPWPKSDGVVSIAEPGGRVRREVALEYKRQQEGIHGLLTAIGQAHGYIHKGYSGALILVPRTYVTLSSPATYVAEVLDRTSGARAIGVFLYDDPDTSSATPFAGKIQCVRSLEIDTSAATALTAGSGPKTQWVHVREGSTTRDAFFRFLQAAKKLSAGVTPPTPAIPDELKQAVLRIAPGSDPAAYLASTADTGFLSRAWQSFWFEWVATGSVLTPWAKRGNTYYTPNAFTKVDKDDGTGKSQIFEGRSNGLKEELVHLLNSGATTEPRAWELFAGGIPALAGHQRKQGVRDRAHSYREDLDSALMQLQWIEADGRPTEYGYRYLSICERYGGADCHAAEEYVGATLLQTGRFAAFLHYVYKLSENVFSADPMSFTKVNAAGNRVFNEDSYTEYLVYLEDEFVNNLRVMRTVSRRGRPRVRTVFQAELTALRNYGFVSSSRHRLGVGIPIDWERVLECLDIEL